MSSRFVSGGTISSSETPAPAEDSSSSQQPQDAKSSRSAEWEIVEKELAAERQRREEQRRKAASGEEKSLYDILQENKAAKQAAFEEQNKIKNQFRALDDDEADFLDEVRERKRRAEEEVRRETEEGLQAFRQAQKGKGGGADGGEEDREGGWGVGRKRRRVKEREVKGVRRKVSGGKDGEGGDAGQEADGVKAEKPQTGSESLPKPAVDKPTKPPALGLGDYGSDSDD